MVRHGHALFQRALRSVRPTRLFAPLASCAAAQLFPMHAGQQLFLGIQFNSRSRRHRPQALDRPPLQGRAAGWNQDVRFTASAAARGEARRRPGGDAPGVPSRRGSAAHKSARRRRRVAQAAHGQALALPVGALLRGRGSFRRKAARLRRRFLQLGRAPNQGARPLGRRRLRRERARVRAGRAPGFFARWPGGPRFGEAVRFMPRSGRLRPRAAGPEDVRAPVLRRLRRRFIRNRQGDLRNSRGCAARRPGAAPRRPSARAQLRRHQSF
mmetsp:Transcript_13263/g.44328  ORF Transcript_13263/g.44328 Transcript_13263/m.44328 type:complete len:269 (+) Transcript_13263:1767-2573(+)